jgi:peptide/nickel transport system permease protein
MSAVVDGNAQSRTGRSQLGTMPRHRSQWEMLWRQLRRDRTAVLGLVIVLLSLLIALFGPSIAPYSPTEQSLALRRAAPTMEHPFGMDEFGRDILSRILTGARDTLGVAVIAVAIGLVTGVSFGLVSGFFGGWTDRATMRLVDGLLAFPYLLLAIVIAGVLGPSLRSAMIAVGIAAMPTYARVTRAMTRSAKEDEYVLAARATGAADRRVLLRHILPNVMGPVVVLATLGMANAILSAAALSFLGLGAQPPAPEWGAMLAQGRSQLLSAPHIVTFPGIAIMVTMLGFNLLGDGFRDALDPRLST